MLRPGRGLFVCLALLLPVDRGLAQGPAAPSLPFAWTFEAAEVGRPAMALGGAEVGFTTTAETSFQGSRALEVRYAFQPDPLVKPPPQGVFLFGSPRDLRPLQSLRLALKTETSFSLLVGLVETGGTVYAAPVFSSAGQWRQVMLAVADLSLTVGAPDANGRLDLDEIAGVAVLEAYGAAQRLAMPGVHFANERRHFWLDEVVLSDTALPVERVALPAESPAVEIIDSCDRPGARFLVAGVFDCKLTTEKAGEGRALCYRFEYTLPGKSAAAFLRWPIRVALARTEGLRLSLRADRALWLMLLAQEAGGATYTAEIEVAPSEEWASVSAAWSDFRRATGAEDSSGGLDPEKIVMLGLVDHSTLLPLSEESVPTTLWVDDLYAIRQPPGLSRLTPLP